MLYDEDDYPDPSAFKPERFIKDGQLDPNVRDPAMIAFGFGRRLVVLIMLKLRVMETDRKGKKNTQIMPWQPLSHFYALAYCSLCSGDLQSFQICG